jgi:hypothetical protein
MRGWVLFIAAGFLGACSSDPITKGRADSGVPLGDGGVEGPIAYRVGMKFGYVATLVYRNSTGEDSRSIYNLTLTVTQVDDEAGRAESTITVTATGSQTFQQNWNPTAGFDSWIARLGPSDTGDVVDSAPLVVHLGHPPAMPPPTPKHLPVDGVLFLDLRDDAAIRSAFFDAFQGTGLMPGFVPPSQHPLMRWELRLSGMDTSIQYYPAALKQRDLTLEYDQRGWLLEATEQIGSNTMMPVGNFHLVLMWGPS